MSDNPRARAIEIWATELAKYLPAGVRENQAGEYAQMIDKECGGVSHINLVGAALRNIKGAKPAAAIRTAAHDIPDPDARTPTAERARDCPACQGHGYAGAWWLRTPARGRQATMERVAITAHTEGMDEYDTLTAGRLAQIWRGLVKPALAVKVQGFPSQDVYWCVSACECEYGRHLARLRATREGE